MDTLRKQLFSRRWNVVLLDLARGGFLTVLLIVLTGWHLEPWEIVFCIAAASGPDWDFGPYFLIEKKVTGLYAHGQIGHYPLLYAVAMVAISLSVPVYVALIVAIQIFFHFVADTINDEWGVAWLGPFSSHRLRYWQGQFQWTDEIPALWLGMKHHQKTLTLWQTIYYRIAKKFFIIPSGEGKLFIGYLVGMAVLVIYLLW